jgi:RNA polymerase sigma-70 factor (ECF subfamily)
MLGSFEDSEDLVQETFLRAWRARASFEGRSSFRAWLYKIATNACLDALERRPRAPAPAAGERPVGEVPWLQPYPDDLLEGVASREDEPDAQVVARETIELAFIAAIQLLPPRQRVDLIARDVLGWSAAESATRSAPVRPCGSACRGVAWTGRPTPIRPRRSAPSSSATSRRASGVTRRRWYGSCARTRSSRCRRSRCPWSARRRSSTAGSRAASATSCGAVAFYVRKPGESDFLPLALDVLRIEDGALAEVIAFPLEPLLEALDLPQTL